MSGAAPRIYLKVYALLSVTDAAERVEYSADVQIMKIKFDLRSDWRIAADIPERIF